MSINSINNYIKSLINNSTNKSNTSASKTSSASTSNTETKSENQKKIASLIDQLELNSNNSNLSSYLNYNAVGQYAALSKYLKDNPSSEAASLMANDETTASEIAELLTDTGSKSGSLSLTDFLSSSSASNSSFESLFSSADEMVSGMIKKNQLYDNYLITSALKRENLKAINALNKNNKTTSKADTTNTNTTNKTADSTTNTSKVEESK
ncbi:MAG: hypothetical protein ACM3UU_02570 [Ignavibacteriales bacterium]